jgi:hypothetical protein
MYRCFFEVPDIIHRWLYCTSGKWETRSTRVSVSLEETTTVLNWLCTACNTNGCPLLHDWLSDDSNLLLPLMTLHQVCLWTHLRKSSVRFSLTLISPLADFTVTEMPPIWLCVYRSLPTIFGVTGNFTEKKFCPSRGLNRRPSDYQIKCLIECATTTTFTCRSYRTKNIFNNQ